MTFLARVGVHDALSSVHGPGRCRRLEMSGSHRSAELDLFSGQTVTTQAIRSMPTTLAAALYAAICSSTLSTFPIMLTIPIRTSTSM